MFDRNEIKRLTLRLGVNQKDFGAALGGYHQSTVCYWETGKVAPMAPAISDIYELAYRSGIQIALFRIDVTDPKYPESKALNALKRAERLRRTGMMT
jgi:predicted transcriptional regulator